MPEPRRSRALLLTTLLLPPLVAALVQAPALGGWFRSDDFVHLYQAENKGLVEYLLTQHGGHLQLTKNAFVLCLWRLFRFEVAPQLGVVLCLHLFDVALLGALARELTRRPVLSAFAATLWGAAPVAQGTLGWLSVSGQVLCTGAVLWILLDLARARSQNEAPSAGVVLRWWILSFVACTSFGIGLSLALALPIVAFLLLEAGHVRRTVLRALAPLWIAVPALYLGLQWAASAIAGTGLRSFSWMRIVDEPVLQLVLLARFLAYGTASLLLGPWASCGQGEIVSGPWAGRPGEVAMRLAWPVAAALVAALGLVAWRVAPSRRPLAAFALLALASYGTIVAGRIPVVLEFDLSLSSMTFWARYHYIGPAFLAVLVALLGAALPTGRVRDGLSVVLGIAWLALVLPLCREATSHAESFVPANGRSEHAAVTAEIERAVERVPAGRTAWLPNLRFSSAHVVRDPFVRFPGWAAVFVMSHPDDELRGRAVRFAEPGAKRLARLREDDPGSRVLGLLVPLEEVPDPPRAELARVLAANRPRRAGSSDPEGDERGSEEDD